MPRLKAALALVDGSVYEGRGFGSQKRVSGEVVFDTTMTGYEEALTDPSFIGQILTMTYPLVGNYGVADPREHPERFESDRIQPFGFVVREACEFPSHRHSRMTINEFLKVNDVPGIQDVDTREITIKIRNQGVMNAALETSTSRIDIDDLVREARERPDYSEFDYVQLASTKKIRFFRSGDCREVGSPRDLEGKRRCVILDCGMKRSIATRVAERGSDVVAVPYDSDPELVLGYEPDFMMVSNGPGDPERAKKPQETIRRLAGELPMMNICLGHQLTALSLGARHYKLKFGHRGGNQPVKDLVRDNVYITTQNHGFAIESESLENTGLRVTMTNLNDGSIEGLVHQDHKIMTTQFHPEATPGPLDANFLFDEFLESL